jgi:hypothetical protein
MRTAGEAPGKKTQRPCWAMCHVCSLSFPFSGRQGSPHWKNGPTGEKCRPHVAPPHEGGTLSGVTLGIRNAPGRPRRRPSKPALADTTPAASTVEENSRPAEGSFFEIPLLGEAPSNLKREPHTVRESMGAVGAWSGCSGPSRLDRSHRRRQSRQWVTGSRAGQGHEEARNVRAYPLLYRP